MALLLGVVPQAPPPRARGMGGGCTCSAAPPAFGADPRLFCFGLGYTALGLCNTLQRDGWTVAGTVRDERRLEALNLRGFPAHLWDPDHDRHLSPQGFVTLRQATHILSTAPPGDLDLDPVLANLGHEIVSLPSLRWLGYLSTTGVYGDWGGDWVTEESKPRSLRPQMVARLAAEESWLDLHRQSSLPVHVFRLGGIYGPGRSVLDALARKGPPRASQVRRGQRRYTSRVHVADVCEAVRLSMERPHPGRVFNVVDDCPAPRWEVVSFARSVVGMDPAEEEGTGGGDGDEGGVGRGEEKRVRNERAKRELGLELIFPTYRDGIEAIARGDDRPFDG